MRTLKFELVFILYFSALIGAFADGISAEKVIEQAIFKYQSLEKYNKTNEIEGKSSLNEYIIELDPEWELNPNWIEEIGEGKIRVTSGKYESLSKMLKDFNDVRKDDLRFYVIVVNNYQALLKETIDISRLPGTIDNLDQLVPPSSSGSYARYKQEISTIPEKVSSALVKAGYTNRIVYFYGVIRLYKLDQKERYYKHDNLSLLGESIKLVDSDIREASKRTFASSDTPGVEVENAVASIINAVNVVVDNGDDSQPSVDCGKSVDDLVAKTKSERERVYTSTVTATAALLDKNPSNYFIVDQPTDFAEDDIFTSAILPDKISLLAKDNSEYKLFVIFKEVSFIMPSGDWKGFAEAVYKESTVAKQNPKNIILVIPYYKLYCTGTFWFFSVSKNTGLLMPGVYCGDSGLNALMNTALAGAGKTWEANFNQCFSAIPKKYKTYDYKFLWDGGLINDGFTDHGTMTGKSNIIESRILEDDRYNQLKSAWNEYLIGSTGVGASGAIGGAYSMNITEQQLQQLATLQSTYSNKVNEIMAKRPQFFYVTKNNLIESRLSQEVANDFTNWYCKHKKLGFLSYFSSPEDEIFYGGKNPEKVDDGLMLIDIASGVASFVGADAIFDGLGAYYAYSNDKYTEAAFYAAAASVPFWSSAVRRAVMEGGTYMLKTAKGTFVSVPKGVLGMNYLFKVEDAFSAFSKTALDVKSFSKAAKYKTETKFIEALEDGMINDLSSIKKLNDNPDLIDEFNVFYKDGKGGLKEFLAKKGEDLTSILKSKGYSLFEEIDNVLFIRDGNGKIGKILDKADPENITWFTPQAGGTWQIHQGNASNYLKFKYGNNVTQQLKVRIYNGVTPPVDCFLDDVVFTNDGKFIISDSKHSQKAAIVDGQIPGYTTNQTQGYQWIVDGSATKIEVIGDKGIPNGINRGRDLLLDLDGKVKILTNNAQGEIVENSIIRTR